MNVNCTGHGECDSEGGCVCTSNYDGRDCSGCAMNYYGSECAKCMSLLLLSPLF